MEKSSQDVSTGKLLNLPIFHSAQKTKMVEEPGSVMETSSKVKIYMEDIQVEVNF